ncbi:unnamed protein product [Ambrosiozyma monospora]|uniref:Unnamed protein product n=1 Tax=Ambrosiozyma monospora TaxID=43982 RepID=A0ACB5SXA1_AMBMO|nr:unnamed protein product [Ambrosiozyma monospora]
MSVMFDGDFKDFYRLGNSNLGVQDLVKDISLVSEIVKQWRNYISDVPEEERKQKSLKLKITSTDEKTIRQCHSPLMDILSKNRDILTTSFGLREFPSPESLDLYFGLFAQCDSVSISEDKNSQNNVEWINDISCLASLSISSKRMFSSRNMHSSLENFT